MVALKKIAESGKVTKIPYTTQTKGKEVAHTSTVKKQEKLQQEPNLLSPLFQ
ncbi:hypothetical protein H6769_00180 [Candidatus Peribacteria bacterium]|nr:hypothetical protein [Candidatus Peribacteria bacterium]